MNTRTVWATWGLLLPLLAAAGGCGGNGAPDWMKLGGDDKADAGEDAAYTILLYVDESPDHVSRMQRYKQQTASDAGWGGLYLVHKAERSELYWGRYETTEDARDNLRRAKEYVAPAGVNVYARALIVPLPGKDIGPPEWNLKNAEGEYTVAVAKFYNVPEANYIGRKQFAVDYTTQLREEGHEAYYHHGPVESVVTIGSFPGSAVEMATIGGVKKPRTADPRITAIQQEFTYLAVNGRVERQSVPNPETGEIVWQEARSQIVHIPSDDEGSQD